MNVPSKEYLIAATSWTHHNAPAPLSRPPVPSPFEGYQEYTGWQVIIMITSECNTQCKHCYLPYKGKIPPNELMMLISHLQHLGYNVYLNGSEPLIDEGYLPAFKLADQRIVMTNGIVINERDADYLKKVKEAGIDTIGISCHFDMQSVFSNIPLEEAISALQKVNESGIMARVMTTITHQNLEMIPEYCSWCYSNGFKNIRFTNFMAQGKAKNLRELVMTNEDRRRYYEIITDQRKKYPIEQLKIDSCGSFGNCGTPNMSCMALRDFVVLTPDLGVYPCFFLAEHGRECGFYRDGRIWVKTEEPPSADNCLALQTFNG